MLRAVLLLLAGLAGCGFGAILTRPLIAGTVFTAGVIATALSIVCIITLLAH